MLDNVASLKYFLPETILSIGVLAILTVDLVARKPDRMRAGAMAIGSIVLALIATFALAGHSPRGLFGGLIAKDPFTDFFRIFFFTTTALVGVAALRTRDAIEYQPGENQ